MKRKAQWIGGALTLGSLLIVGVALAGIFDISVNQEKTLGTKAASEVESKSRLERGGRATEVSRIGMALAAATGNRDYAFSYKVIDDQTINAFAIPGGHVYLYSGMLDRLTNTDQLAGVLGHETTHVVHRHFAKQYRKNEERHVGLALLLGIAKPGRAAETLVNLGDLALTNDYSRQDETDADMTGMLWMKKAGYNPHGMVEMLQILQQASGNSPSIFAWTSDHPQISKRADKARKREAELVRQ